ncbi:MAG: FAD:protein FMN transferase [Phaeodactylibacter sp.]|uniref:FAD:protein FMN transferase n=1 Tax=Phaeodactylibacter sp. TaxID=1940289 RepID=UPI0032EFD785
MKYDLHVIIWVLLGFLFSSCGDTPGRVISKDYQIIEGETMGTYYRVTFDKKGLDDVKPKVDSILRQLNLEVSTYIPQSTISRFNQSDSLFNLNTNPVSGTADSYPNGHFIRNYKKALEIYHETDGYFDATVMPLVNYWGFGYTEKRKVENVDSLMVDSLLQYLGMDKVELQRFDDTDILIKALPGVKLDFSALAKGYGVDLVGQLLTDMGVQHFLVDIGGETLAKGQSPRGDAWKLGINVPEESAAMDEIQTTVPLQDRALATSGNYRNYYEINGQKYSHTINAKTGYPERNTLLSASVFAKDCMTADAYATAFMTMGVEQAKKLASELAGIEAYFIYGLPDGAMAVSYTDGLAEFFTTND